MFSSSFALCKSRKFYLMKDIANLSNIYLKNIKLIVPPAKAIETSSI